MATSIVGLDIGNGVLRAAEVVDGSKGRPTLLRYHSIAIPTSAAHRGEVLERGTIAASLRQLWSSAGFKSKKVALGMGNHRVLVRDVSVPKMPLAQIKESLPFQVQDLLPVPVADALLDFFPVSAARADSGEVINGLLIAAVKEPVLANVEAIQEAGLDPVDVDLIPFALVRSLLGENQVGPGTTALVHVGATMTIIVVATDGVPQFVRVIQSGSEEINAALTKRLGIDAGQAEQVKRGLGLSSDVTPEWKPAVETIASVTGDLLDGVRNTLSFFVNTHAGVTVDRVAVSGGGAQLSGFAQALAEATRLPVGVPDVLSTMSVAKTVDAAKLHAEAGGLPVAAGLAIGVKA